MTMFAPEVCALRSESEPSSFPMYFESALQRPHKRFFAIHQKHLLLSGGQPAAASQPAEARDICKWRNSAQMAQGERKKQSRCEEGNRKAALHSMSKRSLTKKSRGSDVGKLNKLVESSGPKAF